MVVYKGFTTNTKARDFAKKMRKKGFRATAYPLYAVPGNEYEGIRDWRVSVTKKRKK